MARMMQRGFLFFLCFLTLVFPVRAERLQRWMYYSGNLWVDDNVSNLQALMTRAAKAGYTHVLISDSKFSRLGTMDQRYFNNLNKVKAAAATLGLQIVPAIFPIGYSNDLLFQDPNLIEALPATNTLLVVSNGLAVVQADPAVTLKGGDFSNLAAWDWKDPGVTSDNGAARIVNPNGQNARIVQKLNLAPFRQYHISVRIKAQDFRGTPELKVIAPGGVLNYNPLGVKATQDWTTHHVVFNSLTNTQANLYLGCWGGTTGTVWFDDAAIQETAFLNLVRRPGAPLVVQRENGPVLVEGKDFAPFKDPDMGVKPWPGCYDVFHTPPVLPVNLPDGTRLRASWCHAMTVYDGQANICVSEPATLDLLRDQARRMHAAWQTKGYMMSHDEIRVFNWCPACQQRRLEAGAMLADNARACVQLLREANPGGNIYVWSDMFDPHHNAHDNYYLVRGNLTNSWLGLDTNVVIVPWYYEQREASLKFFAGRGHRQVLAGYYDDNPANITNWLASAKGIPGVLGVMYTTWVSRYGDLEAFSSFISRFEVSHIWRIDWRRNGPGLLLELPTVPSSNYAILRSEDWGGWRTWTNIQASGPLTRCFDLAEGPHTGIFYRAEAR
jgi:hypothetical protein